MFTNHQTALKLAAFALAGATAGAGAFALAPAGAASPSGPSADHGRAAPFLARHVIHAQWTTRNGNDHAAIRGTVKALTGHAVVVYAKDNVRQTWRVDAETKVRIRGDDHLGPDSLSEVSVGDRILVVGTGDHDARRVVARTPRK